MRRILVVAHKTLGGDHLLDEVRRRLAEGDASFHLVVPEDHSGVGSWSEGQVHAAATKVLEAGLARFRELDPTGSTDFTGEIGDSNPVHAVNAIVYRGETFDEIILSTLPPGPSRWLHQDVPTRMRKEFAVPITHVVADRSPTGVR
ncbi:MAG: hypothetical protein QOH64_2395 [Acidimicrobiaceae bacterium]|jgi:hypothetical protein